MDADEDKRTEEMRLGKFISPSGCDWRLLWRLMCRLLALRKLGAGRQECRHGDPGGSLYKPISE
jgi:hypothetical protein